jgi:hypothetical protein
MALAQSLHVGAALEGGQPGLQIGDGSEQIDHKRFCLSTSINHSATPLPSELVHERWRAGDAQEGECF